MEFFSTVLKCKPAQSVARYSVAQSAAEMWAPVFAAAVAVAALAPEPS